MGRSSKSSEEGDMGRSSKSAAPPAGMVRVLAPAHLVGSAINGQVIPKSRIVLVAEAKAAVLVARMGFGAMKD